MLLDGHALRTPQGTALAFAREELAWIVAREWHEQTRHIEPSTMPMTSLASVLLDVVPARREQVVEELMRFLTTDAVCFLEPQGDSAGGGDRALRAAQDRLWVPLLEWMTSRFGPIGVVDGHLGVPQHAPETRAAVQDALSQLSDAKLGALESVTQGCKSIVIALALAEDRLDVDGAFHAARLEEEEQMRVWGVVEGSHDVDRAALRAQLAAAKLMMDLGGGGVASVQRGPDVFAAAAEGL